MFYQVWLFKFVLYQCTQRESVTKAPGVTVTTRPDLKADRRLQTREQPNFNGNKELTAIRHW